MPLQREDTIYALSSGRLPAAIAIVRISGSRARIGLETLGGKVPEPRRAARAIFRDPSTGTVIDDGLVLWFAGPASETGEDVAELHLHGGRAVVAAVFGVLGRLDGFRPAEAGEFTRRALLNGKLDLAAVEGLGDLVAAETEAQRRQAMAQFRGALSAKVETWRGRLVEVMARLEAGIDFSDEGDVPDDLLRPAVEIARELASGDPRGADRCAAWRAAAGRLRGGDCRAAERGEIHVAEPARRARCRDRLGDPGHDTGRH